MHCDRLSPDGTFAYDIAVPNHVESISVDHTLPSGSESVAVTYLTAAIWRQYSYTDLRSDLDGLRAALNVGANTIVVNVQGTTSRQYVLTVIRLAEADLEPPATPTYRNTAATASNLRLTTQALDLDGTAVQTLTFRQSGDASDQTWGTNWDVRVPYRLLGNQRTPPSAAPVAPTPPGRFPPAPIPAPATLPSTGDGGQATVLSSSKSRTIPPPPTMLC